jgi:heavy-metal exporter, HME family
MFAYIVRISLANRVAVLGLAALIMLIGMWQLPRLPIDVLPDLDQPTVTIMTEAEGLSPVEVELSVTYPLETAMNGLPGLKRLRSASGVGLSVMYLEFDWSSDLIRNRQLVSERLAALGPQMPRGISPQMGPMTSIMGEIMLVALSGTNVHQMELRDFADFTLRPRLLSVPGIAQVIPIGGEVRQMRVSPRPNAMRAANVGYEQIEATLKRFGVNTGGGYVDQGGREFMIRGVGQTRYLDDLAAAPVETRGSGFVQLRQVADVSFSARPKRGDAGHDGAPAVIVSVQKQPGTDTVALTRQVEAALASLQRNAPMGMRVDKVQFRQADFIEAAIGNVSRAFIEAIVVVALVLAFFLMSGRATLVSLVAIPLSVLTSVLVFKALGLGVNTMTLGGLAIAVGELVDDAVVDVENILRRLADNDASPQPRSTLNVIVAASQEVRSGVVMATAIIALVLLPVFALSGIEGRMFAPLGLAYVVSILCSLLVAVTVTPVLASYMLERKEHRIDRENRALSWIEDRARALIDLAFRHSNIVLGTICAAVVLAGIVASLMPRAFLPTFNEGSLTINLTARPGLSLAESDRLARLAEELILAVPEVKSVGRRTGRAELDEHAEGVHSSEIDVSLKGTGRTRAAVAADVRTRLNILPVSVNVGQPISHRIDHLMAGVRAEIALKIEGDDLDTLRTLAENFRTRMSSVKGLTDVQVERQARVPQIRIDVDHARAALYGLRAADITEAVEMLSNGRVVSQVVDGTRRIDVVMRLSDTERGTTSLGDITLRSPSGEVALKQVARVTESDGPNQVLRENGVRRIAVLANGNGSGDITRAAASIEALIRETALPSGYSARLEGTFQARSAAARIILGLSLVSLVLIAMLLYSRYRSGVMVAIVMASVPLAFVGGVAALTIAGETLSIASLVGFITLTGITTRNAILKTSNILNLAVSGVPFSRALVVEGSLERLRPVLLTALSAGLALIPLLIGGGDPGKEILHPVAVTIFGGLLVATALDTVVTPLLIHTFGRADIERIQYATWTSQEHQDTPATSTGEITHDHAF